MALTRWGCLVVTLVCIFIHPPTGLAEDSIYDYAEGKTESSLPPDSGTANTSETQAQPSASEPNPLALEPAPKNETPPRDQGTLSRDGEMHSASSTATSTQADAQLKESSRSFFNDKLLVGIRLGFGGSFVKQRDTRQNLTGLNGVPITARALYFLRHDISVGLDLSYLAGLMTGVLTSVATGINSDETLSTFQLIPTGRYFFDAHFLLHNLKLYGGLGLAFGFHSYHQVQPAGQAAGSASSVGPAFSVGAQYDYLRNMGFFVDVEYLWYLNSKIAWDNNTETELIHTQFTAGAGGYYRF